MLIFLLFLFSITQSFLSLKHFLCLFKLVFAIIKTSKCENRLFLYSSIRVKAKGSKRAFYFQPAFLNKQKRKTRYLEKVAPKECSIRKRVHVYILVYQNSNGKRTQILQVFSRFARFFTSLGNTS